MANDWLKKEDLEALERGIAGEFAMPKPIQPTAPIPFQCPHCGNISHLTRLFLVSWPEHIRENTGIVGVCPVCGIRKQIVLQSKKEAPVVPPTDPPPGQKSVLPFLAALLGVLLVGVTAALVYFVLNSAPSPIPSPTPVPTPTPTPEPEPESSERTLVSHYTVHYADVTWDEAEDACEADSYQGVSGHLAVITSQEEYQQVVSILEDYLAHHPNAEKLKYVWIGGWIYDEDAENGVNSYQWVTGEPWTFDNWCYTHDKDGKVIQEPSFYDGDLLENRLILWGYQHESIGWTFSDQNADLPLVYPAAKGEIGYICEFETEES